MTQPDAARRGLFERRRHRWTLWTLLTVVLLQPTPDRVSDTVAGDLGDPIFLTWTLSWGAHALGTAPLDAMDANIFHAESGMLALSDPMLSLAPVFGLFDWLTGDAIAALNLLMIALYVMALCASWALGRRLSGRADLGVVVAVVVCCNAYVFGQANHPQLQTFGFVPLAFLALFRALEHRRARDGLALGAAVVVLALANLTYGLIFVVSAAVAVGVLALRGALPPLRTLVRPALPALAVAGAVLGPIAAVYLHVSDTHDLDRPYEPQNSLLVTDLITPQRGNWLWGTSLDSVNSFGEAGEHPYFPGFVAMLLGLVGLVALARHVVWARRRGSEVPPLEGVRRVDEVVALAVAGAVALVLAVGPSPGGLPGPFRFFHAYVPGFSGIRVTSRFAVVAFVAAAPLVALGVERVRSRLAGRWSALVIPAFVLVAVAETGGPMARVEVPEGEREVYEALAARPDGAVLELPIHVPEEGFAWPFVESMRMYRATVDFNPRVNGYSGGAPSGFTERARVLGTWPSPEAEALLSELDVRYVVLHTGVEQGYAALDPLEAEQMALAAGDAGATVGRHGADWLVELP